jgi:hypothetical protein
MQNYAPPEERIKHLELIQSVISRMGSNAFVVKGWALTVVAGFLALLATRRTWVVPAVGLVPLLGFWSLDASFLRQERLFRRLYELVRIRSEAVPVLSMDVSVVSDEATWWGAVRSPTLFNFYGTLALANVLVLIISANF